MQKAPALKQNIFASLTSIFPPTYRQMGKISANIRSRILLKNEIEGSLGSSGQVRQCGYPSMNRCRRQDPPVFITWRYIVYHSGCYISCFVVLHIGLAALHNGRDREALIRKGKTWIVREGFSTSWAHETKQDGRDGYYHHLYEDKKNTFTKGMGLEELGKSSAVGTWRQIGRIDIPLFKILLVRLDLLDGSCHRHKTPSCELDDKCRWIIMQEVESFNKFKGAG